MDIIDDTIMGGTVGHTKWRRYASCNGANGLSAMRVCGMLDVNVVDDGCLGRKNFSVVRHINVKTIRRYGKREMALIPTNVAKTRTHINSLHGSKTY